MSEYQDPTFRERWPLLSRILRTTAKVIGVAGVITMFVGFATQLLLGGNSQSVVTHANGITTTTITQNDFFYSLNFLFPLGMVTALEALLLWVYVNPLGEGPAHLNSETEVEE